MVGKVAPPSFVYSKTKMLATVMVHVIPFKDVGMRKGSTELRPQRLKLLTVVKTGLKLFDQQLIVRVHHLSMLNHVHAFGLFACFHSSMQFIQSVCENLRLSHDAFQS